MKKILIAAVLILVAASIAWAATDYSCLNKCMNDGYGYQICKRWCSY